jgi:hypothetical protein
MNWDNISQVGLGVVVAMLILDRVFSFLRDQKNGKSKNGASCVSRAEITEALHSKVDAEVCVERVKRLEDKLDEGQRRFDKVDTDLGSIKQMITGLK